MVCIPFGTYILCCPSALHSLATSGCHQEANQHCKGSTLHTLLLNVSCYNKITFVSCEYYDKVVKPS
jgi:hypothetical protein